jgi:hypothetical protein
MVFNLLTGELQMATKQLNLNFMIHDAAGKATQGRFMMVNLGNITEVEEKFSDNNRNEADFIWITVPLKTYKKFKMLASLTNKYAEDNWNEIDYGFDYNQFNTFRTLV